MPASVHEVIIHDVDSQHALTSQRTMPEHIDPHFQKKKRLAYVITITKDGFFQDGAAVLAYR